MSRKSIAPQSRRHIWVFDDDWAYLDATFGKRGNAYGTGAAIRRILQIYVANLRAKEQAAIEQHKQLREEDVE